MELLPENLKQYGQVLINFNDVRLSCFGQKFQPGYKLKIRVLKESFEKLPPPSNVIYPKAHEIFDHIGHFVDEHGALGQWAEQVFESIHYEWADFWGKSYKLPLSNPNYANRLLNAVVDFNTLRI